MKSGLINRLTGTTFIARTITILHTMRLGKTYNITDAHIFARTVFIIRLPPI